MELCHVILLLPEVDLAHSIPAGNMQAIMIKDMLVNGILQILQ